MYSPTPEQFANYRRSSIYTGVASDHGGPRPGTRLSRWRRMIRTRFFWRAWSRREASDILLLVSILHIFFPDRQATEVHSQQHKEYTLQANEDPLSVPAVSDAV